MKEGGKRGRDRGREGGEVGRNGVNSLSWGRVICDDRKIQEAVK